MNHENFGEAKLRYYWDNVDMEVRNYFVDTYLESIFTSLRRVIIICVAIGEVCRLVAYCVKAFLKENTCPTQNVVFF